MRLAIVEETKDGLKEIYYGDLTINGKKLIEEQAKNLYENGEL